MDNNAMRRHDRALNRDEALGILDQSRFGTLSMCAPDKTPYSVALHFVRDGERLYFHAAQAGLKTELLRLNPKICALFVQEAEVIERKFTTRYASALVRGTAREVVEDAEKRHALRLICARFAPGAADLVEKTVADAAGRTAVWRVDIESITGKANRAAE